MLMEYDTVAYFSSFSACSKCKEYCLTLFLLLYFEFGNENEQLCVYSELECTETEMFHALSLLFCSALECTRGNYTLLNRNKIHLQYMESKDDGW